VYGVFLSFDVLLLFVFYELTIIPKYFLIARWGSTRKEYGAMKLALYSFVGSHLVLIGLVATWVVARAQTGHATLNLQLLSQINFPPVFNTGSFPSCSSVSPFSLACGPSTLGRPPAMWLRPPPAPCCSPAWS